MLNSFHLSRLNAQHATAVQSCFDSQPKVMMALKKPGQRPYANTFLFLLASGCVAYGQWDGNQLRAFSIVWPWPTAPASTLVMGCNRPTGRPYNPIQSGLQASVDACLLHLENNGRRVLYFVRSSGRAWKNSTATRNQGRFGEYLFTAAEHIPQGNVSQYSDFNRFVLGNQPVSSDAVVVAALAPMKGDY